VPGEFAQALIARGANAKPITGTVEAEVAKQLLAHQDALTKRFVALPWRRASIPVLLVGLSLAALGIGLADLARAVGDPEPFFIFGRFAAPAGYANAACAVYIFAFWPLAYIAARREVPAVARGALLGCGTALVELAVLTQSRGSLLAVPVALVCYLAIVSKRLRAALPLLIVVPASSLTVTYG